MQAHHEVHAFGLQAGEVEPAAKGAVHEERVAPAQAVEKPAQERQIMHAQVAVDGGQPRAAAQIKEPEPLQVGKATAGLLRTGLWVARPQRGRVRQAHPGAIGHQQTAFAPRTHEPPGDLRAEPAKPAHREPRARRAIGTRGAGRQRAPLQSTERLHAGERLFARGAGIHNLPQKGPKRHRRSKHRMPTVDPALLLRVKQCQRQPAPEKGAQLGRAEPVGRGPFPQDFLLRRDRPAAK